VNPDQIKGVVRIVLGIVGGYLIARGVDKTAVGNAINAVVDAVPVIASVIGAVMPVAAAAWSAIRHTNANQVLVAKDIPGVVKIEINRTADPAVKDIARDDSIRKVTFAPPGV